MCCEGEGHGQEIPRSGDEGGGGVGVCCGGEGEGRSVL